MTYAVADVLAHDAPMILIDRVVSHDLEQIETATRISEQSPFLSGGKVPAYVVIEYMAQSVAAYSGIRAKENGQGIKIGFLLGTRKLELNTDGFAIGDEIIVQASQLYNDGEMASFDCLAKKGEKIVAKARLNVYQPTDETLKMETKTDG